MDTNSDSRDWHAAEHGSASTVRAMGLKYPGFKRQTVSDFKLAQVENLMKKVIETVTNLRLRGTPVSAAVTCAVPRGIIVANDRLLLLGNGGYIVLVKDGPCQVLYPFENLGRKMTRCMATTAKIPIAPALLNETKLNFQRKIKQLQAWNKISENLIIIFD